MKEFLRGRSHYGSFIVDGRGTILGFDQALGVVQIRILTFGLIVRFVWTTDAGALVIFKPCPG